MKTRHSNALDSRFDCANRRKIDRAGPAPGGSAVVGLFFLLSFLLCHTSSGQILSDVNINVSDGISLEATIARPIGFPRSGGFPAIVLVPGFGGKKDDMLLLSITMAAYGYASLAYSARGQGNSGGLSTISGDRERQDLFEIIQYLRNLPDINPNKLGVTGGSQGGIHSWMAAVYRMPGVKAVAPLIATPDFARALVPNGCMKYGLPRELTVGSVRYTDERDRLRDLIIADHYDSVLAYIDAWDLAHLVDSVSIPVLQGLGWADFLFPANGGIAARQRLAARHVPIWSYYGTNGHGEEINAEEAAFLLDKIVHWFDHWLKGFSLDQDSLPVVMYSDDRPDWPHHTSTTWPPLPSNTLRLYLTQKGLTRSAPPDSEAFPFSLAYDSSYTPAMGWDDLYGGSAFVRAFTSTSSRLISDVFQSDMEVTGIPSGRIFVESDAPKFQSHVRFYDVTATDTGYVWTLMSRSINGIRLSTPAQVHEIAIEGTALSHIVRAGHRIGVEVTSLDILSGDQANTIPYFVSSHSRLLTSPSSASYVEIPIVGLLPTAVAGQQPVLPEGFALQQNYPNPFNPNTEIGFRIADGGLVTLKVYDLLGREVATLVSQELPAGSYEATFDASRLAGGVYFYCLSMQTPSGQQRSFTVTRKMLLLR
ncbi:MAG: CocE/NonD family hydrolase [Bacteroidota bacterium]